jgi:hypothetical protein
MPVAHADAFGRSSAARGLQKVHNDNTFERSEDAFPPQQIREFTTTFVPRLQQPIFSIQLAKPARKTGQDGHGQKINAVIVEWWFWVVDGAKHKDVGPDVLEYPDHFTA